MQGLPRSFPKRSSVASGLLGERYVTSILGAMKNIGPAVIKLGLITEEEYAQFLASIEDDFEKGEGIQITYRMIRARKPI